MKYKKILFSEIKEGYNDTTKSLMIKTPLWIPHLLIPSVLIFGLVWLTAKDLSIPYLPLVIAIIGLLLYEIWKFFDPANTITIDIPGKFFLIKSRNPIKRLFTGKKKISNNDISCFMLTESNDVLYNGTRYFVTAKLKDSSTLIFTQSTDKSTSEKIVIFLNRVLDRS